MAITYPRTLPTTIRFVRTRFTLVHGAYGSGRTRGGAVQSVEISNPYWNAEIQSPPLRSPDILALQSWWDTLRGGLKTFVAHDVARPWPINYGSAAAVTGLTRAGGGSFDGTASITALPSTNTITFGSGGSLRLPAGFVLKVGDYLSIISTGSPTRYSLHRIAEDQTADASGIVTELAVEPHVNTALFAVADAVNFLRPLAEFVPVPESWQGDAVPMRSSVTFSANSVAA